MTDQGEYQRPCFAESQMKYGPKGDSISSTSSLPKIWSTTSKCRDWKELVDSATRHR